MLLFLYQLLSCFSCLPCLRNIRYSMWAGVVVSGIAIVEDSICRWLFCWGIISIIKKRIMKTYTNDDLLHPRGCLLYIKRLSERICKSRYYASHLGLLAISNAKKKFTCSPRFIWSGRKAKLRSHSEYKLPETPNWIYSTVEDWVYSSLRLLGCMPLPDCFQEQCDNISKIWSRKKQDLVVI